MYNLIKKVTAFCMTILLIVITCISSIPAYADGDGSITVLDSYSDEKYVFFKLLDVEYSTTGDKTNYKYTVPSKFDAFYEEIIDGYSSSLSSNEKSKLVYDYLSAFESDSREIDEFAGRVSQYVGSSPDYISYVLQGTDNTDGTTLNNVEYGYYLMVPEYANNTSDYSMSKVLSLTTAAPNASVAVKNSYPDITKKIVGARNRLYDCNSACIGEEIEYQLTTYVPNVANYVYYDSNGEKHGSYVFQIVDLMSKGLTYKQGSMTITIDGDELTENVDYKLTFESYPDEPAYGGIAGVSGFILDFTDIDNNTFNFYNLAMEYGTDAVIKIRYKAILNEKAIVGTKGNPNYVKLYYSNDPRQLTLTGETPFDEVKTYTDSVQFVKSDGVTKEPITSGAEFEFYTNTTTLDISGIKISTNGTATYNSTTKKWSITTGNDGKVTINGLAAGTYILNEVSAPSGYSSNGSSATITVRIPTTNLKINDPHDINEDGDVGDSNSHLANISHTVVGTPSKCIDGIQFDSSGQFTFKFLNFSQSVLPETGSLTLIIAAGIGLIGIGLSFFFVGKKKKKV